MDLHIRSASPCYASQFLVDHTVSAPAPESEIRSLFGAVESLRDDVVAQGEETLEGWRPQIERREYLPSAQNLARYLALRRRDLRDLQRELMPWGLSSLGRCEARVLENLDALRSTLEVLSSSVTEPPGWPSATEYFRGHRLLERETEEALGPVPAGRGVRIMVTIGRDLAESYEDLRELVARGMDIARVNCGHDGPEMWTAVAENVRRASAETGRPCRVCMDISGPRSRTGAVSAPERLQVGDTVVMTDGREVDNPVSFECSLREAVQQIEPGQSVWVDEGRLGAVVESKLDGAALLRVTHARDKGEHLKRDKGLNFPNTELVLDPLTPKDRKDLDTVAQMADIVGYSFVQTPEDVATLQGELAARVEHWREIALVAKVETQQAVRNLPELIVQGAGRQPFAVMIARGDLAVEIGPRRLAEIQEELLWLCEAAHVPVIWATQVLDTFVHKGIQSRAEITDAAMAERAECVMLNKGPFVADAVSLLDGVLGAMEGHQFKKASRMRALRSW
jgi:pyruvate kinase